MDRAENMAAIGRANRKHGHTCLNGSRHRASRTYRSWTAMIGRCHNPQSHAWAQYGGRGIVVCAAWHTFEGFLRDMGERPPGRSLDRINNDGAYEKANCRWATPKEQQNNRRACHLLTIDGETLTVTQWSDRSGVNRDTIYARLHRGWPARESVWRSAWL